MKRKSSGRAATTASQMGWGRSCWAQEPKAIRRSGCSSAARAPAGQRSSANSSKVQRWRSTVHLLGEGLHVKKRFENPSPRPPPRSGEGEQGNSSPRPERERASQFFPPSPLRGGGRGEGFRNGFSAQHGRSSSYAQSAAEPAPRPPQAASASSPWNPRRRRAMMSGLGLWQTPPSETA